MVSRLPFDHATAGRRHETTIRRTLAQFRAVFGSLDEEPEKGTLTFVWQYQHWTVRMTERPPNWAAAYHRKNPNADHGWVNEQSWRAAYSDIAWAVKVGMNRVGTGQGSFDEIFMQYIVRPDGRTMYEWARDNKLLPGPDRMAA